MFFPYAYMIWASRVWSLGVLGMLRLVCGIKHEVEGWKNIPDEPVLFAFKHQSAWDTIVLPIILPGAVAVLKYELQIIPFYGWYLRKYGTIAIDRGRGVSSLRNMRRKARAFISSGRSLIVFPEGTRVPPGQIGILHPGITALYTDLGIPVIPVALNSGRLWQRRKFFRYPGTITLKFLPPIEPGLKKREFLHQLTNVITEAQTKIDPPKNYF